MMLDPLSIAASISGLLTLAGSVLSSGYGYVGSVQGAPQELRRLLQETAALDMVLDQMKILADPSKHSKVENQTMANMANLFASGRFEECQKILESVRNSIKRCEQHGGQRANNVLRSAIWPFKEKETKATLNSLRGLSDAFLKALSIDTAISVQDTRKRVIEIQSDQHVEKRRRIAVDDEMLAWKKENDRRIEEQDYKQRTKEDLQLLQWLSPVNEQISHDAASGKHHEGTGTWIFTNSTFHKWIEGDFSHLWLHAKAGAGKTNLVSTIINSTSKKCTGTRKALAYFYCDFRNDQTLDVTNVIGSILRQLVSKLQAVPTPLRRLYNNSSRNQTPGFKVLYDIILKDVQPEFDQILVIIDGVDECTDRSQLLSILEDTEDLTPKTIKWLISSRKEIDIERALSGKPAVCIQNDQVSEDVSIYVKSRIETDERLQRLPEAVKSEIMAKLIAGAEGMFRWVECQLEDLKEARTIKAVIQTLAKLPRGLDETYVRILQKIPPGDQELARRAFTWILCSRKPIDLLELAEAITTEEGAKSHQPEARLIDIWEAMDICRGLLSVTIPKDSQKEFVSFSHYSVQEFLLSSRIPSSYPEILKFSVLEQSGHEYLAQVCLAYLAIDELRPKSGDNPVTFRSLTKKYPLLGYAFFNWAAHCEVGKYEFEGLAYERLFGGIVCYFPYFGPSDDPLNKELYLASNQSALAIATIVGCLRLVKNLVAKGADVNERVSDYWDEIEYHSDRGILLYHYPKGRSMIQTAMDLRHDDILMFLIGSGANFEGFNSWGDFPWNFFGTVEYRTAKVLLDNGADPNSQLKGKTLIEYAAAFDLLKMVQMLLDYGADPHLGNPLGIAKTRKCVKAIRLFENLGVRSKGEEYLNVHEQ